MQQDRLGVDTDTEERVGFPAQVASFVIANLAVQLVRRDVKIPVSPERERI